MNGPTVEPAPEETARELHPAESDLSARLAPELPFNSRIRPLTAIPFHYFH